MAANLIPVSSDGGFVTSGNITGGNIIGPLANGNSNVNIATANGNVSITSNGTHTWNFDDTGNLQIPVGITASTSNQSIELSVFDDGDSPSISLINRILANDQPTTTVQVSPTQVTIQSNLVGNLQEWAFDDTGNLTLPGNTFSVNYANGNQVSLAGNIQSSISNGNSNVDIATSNGNVTINSAGNTILTVTGTGANITGTLSASGDITGNNLTTGGDLSVTGNATVGNLVTGGSSGNISGANVITANLFTGTLTTNSQPNITSTGTLASLSVTANSNVGNLYTGGIVSATGNITGNYFIGNGSQLTDVVQSLIKPNNLVYVAKNGNDSTGTGSINAPYLTIQTAIDALVGSTAATIIVAPGNYVGNLTIDNVANALNITGSGLSETSINGNVVISGTSNNIEFDNLRIATGRVTHSATGYWSVINTRFSANTGITKTSSSTIKIFNTDLGAAGTGNILLQAGKTNIYSSQVFNVQVSGASTEVNLLQCDTVILPTVTAGNVNFVDSIIVSSGSGNSLNAVGGYVTLKNCLSITPTRTLAPIGFGASASYSYGDSAFDVGNSTFAGTAVVQPGQFQSINVTGGNITTNGFISATGNANVGNIGATGGVFTTVAGNLTTAAQPNITSTGTLSSLSVTGNITAGNLLVASRGAIGVAPQQEIHVAFNGSDTDGNGSVTNPYRTITYAITQAGSGTVIVVHPGEYTEDVTVNNLSAVTITAAAPGSATPQAYVITGNVVVSGTSGSVLLHSVGVVGNITHSSSGSFFVTAIQMGTGGNSTTFNKTGTGYLEVFNGNWSGGTPAVNVTGAGLVTFNGVQLTNLTVNNANASVILRNIPSANNTILTSGTLTVISSTMVGNSNTAAAITTVAGTLNIQNSILLRANNTAGIMTVGASTAYLYDDIFFDRANSTLSGIPISGTAFAPPAEFQAINADSLSVVGNITVGNISGANVISANLFTGTLTTSAQPNITSTGTLSSLSVSGNSNIGNIGTGIITATGNVTGANLITGGNVNASIIVNGGTGVYLAPGPSGYINFFTTGGDKASVSDTGNIIASNVVANSTVFAVTANISGNVNAGNVSGTLLTGTLTTAAQPNITSTGTLSSLSVTGNSNIGNIGTGIITATGNVTSANLITGGIVSATGNVTGNFFIGNGSQLTSVTALNANVSLVSNNQEYSPLLATNTTGNLPFRASAGISWNPSSYALTAGKILLGSGIGAQGVTGTYAFGANTAWKVQSQNGTNTDAQGQEIGRFGSEYTSGASTFWDSYTSYFQGSGASSGWMILNAAGNSVANVTGTGIAVTGTLSASGNVTGANLVTGGLITATGNLNAGNIITGGIMSSTGNATHGNLSIPSGNVTVTYAPVTAVGATLTVSAANTQGGTGYADFLKAINTSGGATNANKFFRLDSTGSFEIINSAYNGTILSLTNAGALNVPGPISVSGKQAVNGPAFRAYISVAQAITSGSQQQVTFGSETFDTNSNFASNTFTPTVEGYYQLNATVRIAGISGTAEVMIILYKNGAEYSRGTNESGNEQGTNFYSMQVSDIAYANGTTDYFEIYIQQSSGSNKDTTAGQAISYFSGIMVRGA